MALLPMEICPLTLTLTLTLTPPRSLARRRRRRRRKQKKNSKASQPPPVTLMTMIPQQVFFSFFGVISFVWDIGICDNKVCLMFSGFWFLIVEVRVYVC